MVLLKAVGSCEYEGFSLEFCDKFSLRPKAMKEIRKLRMQLTNTGMLEYLVFETSLNIFI